MKKENLKLQNGDKYYFITKQNTITWAYWGSRPDFDSKQFTNDNVFLSREDAQSELDNKMSDINYSAD